MSVINKKAKNHRNRGLIKKYFILDPEILLYYLFKWDFNIELPDATELNDKQLVQIYSKMSYKIKKIKAPIFIKFF